MTGFSIEREMREWWELSEQEHLQMEPRFTLRSVLCGPYDSPQSHEAHLAKTFGVGDPLFDTLDEFRFSPATNLLESVRLSLPETLQDCSVLLAELTRAPARCVRPRYRRPPPTEFLLGAEVSWIDDDGAFLIGLAGDARAPVHERFQIANRLELFFGPGVHGWVLRRPALCLTTGWTAPVLSEEPCGLGPLLATYVRLRSEETIDALEDGDPRPRSQFVALYENVRPLAETAQGRVLATEIEQVADTFGFDLPRHEPGIRPIS